MKYNNKKGGRLMILKKATSENAKAVLELYRSVIGRRFCVWDENYPNEQTIREDINANTLYILEDEGRIIGAASVVPENECDHLECWQCEGREIARVAVAPEFQGWGLSKAIMSRIIDDLRQQGCKSVHLLAAVENIPAVRTYKRLGFEFYDEVEEFGHIYYPCEKLL